ncbi:MAG: tRNA (cytidine(56)-2'-O)-methyltransferase [Candidatus Helarchaeota archaeon]
MQKIVILRLGHRILRDKRITTHIGLVGRAFGADGMLLADAHDSDVEESIRKINQSWGGNFFVQMDIPSVKYIKDWANQGNIIVHLTMYGESIGTTLIKELKETHKDILIIVGSQKVPRLVYKLANYNISISNQPHSEVAALAIFLDRYFEGKQLSKKFDGAKLEITPSKRGKIVKKL